MAEPAAPPLFTCETAAAALGRPELAVQNCFEYPRLPGVYGVTLTGEAGGWGGLVRVEGGVIQRETGMPAASAWLRAKGLMDAPDLTLDDLSIALQVFEAFPPGFDRDSVSFELEGVGRSGFSTPPFKLWLITPFRPPGRPGGLGQSAYRRATLAAGEDGRLAWTVAQGRGQSWSTLSTIPAE